MKNYSLKLAIFILHNFKKKVLEFELNRIFYRVHGVFQRLNRYIRRQASSLYIREIDMKLRKMSILKI